MRVSLERVQALFPPLLFFGGFAAYVSCLGGYAGWLDSGELLTGAHHLGISHPPGQPLYTLLAKATLLFPAGGLGFRGALLSALAGAASWPILYSVMRLLMRAVARGVEDRFAPLVAAATTVAFGLLGPPSMESTRAEVYLLTLVFLLAALGLLLAWRERRDARLLPLAALALGLTAALHPLLGVVVLGVGLLFALLIDKRGLGQMLGISAAAMLLGAAVYLLLPLRAGADFAWGEPRNAASFLSIASGAPYAATYAEGGQPLWDRILGHLALLYRQVGWEVVVLAAVGFAFLFRRALRSALLVGGAGAATLATAVAQRIFYPENPDVSGYLLLTLAVLFMGATLPVGFEGPRLPPRVEAWLAVLCAAAIVGATPHELRRQDDHPERYVRAALATVPPRGLVLVDSDHAAFSLLFAQRVEQDRPDVSVAVSPLLTSSWYLRALKRWTPDLFVPFVDDGRADALRERIGKGNASQRTIFIEPPGEGAVDLGILGQVNGLAGEGARPDTLASWEASFAEEAPGELTRRVDHFAAMRRAALLSAQGDLAGAANRILRTLGEEVEWLPLWEALARTRLLPLPGMPSFRTAAPVVRRFSASFLYSERQAGWQAGDLLWSLGLSGLATPWLLGTDAPEGALARAVHLARSGELAAAEAALAEMGPHARDGRVALARAEALDGRVDGALKILAPLLAGEDDLALALAGALEAERGALASAERYLRASLRVRPGAPEPLTNLGLVYAKQSRFTEAETVWREAAQDPRAQRARSLLARLRAERR
jgi:hypothetical protein